MKRITLNFVDGDLMVPFVKFTSGGKDLYAILDTGDESTFISQSILDDFPEIKSETKVEIQGSYSGFSGDSTMDAILSEIQAGIETAGGEKASLDFEATLSDLSFLSEKVQKRFDYPVTLAMLAGMDFLKRHKAKLDIGKRTVSLLVRTGRSADSKKSQNEKEADGR